MALTLTGTTENQVIRDSVVMRSAMANYDAVLDALSYWQRGQVIPHLSEPVNAYLSLLIDADSGRTAGFRIDNFLAFAVHEHPALLPLAQYLDLVPRERGDTRLFAKRIIRQAHDHDDELAAQAKWVIINAIEATGGIEPGMLTDARFAGSDES